MKWYYLAINQFLPRINLILNKELFLSHPHEIKIVNYPKLRGVHPSIETIWIALLFLLKVNGFEDVQPQ
jgi:hypothetical protein